MHEMLKQLGELLLGSVPTALMLIFLWTMYSILVHKPLAKVLAERRAKTEGAIEKARADVAAAEARTGEYEQRLREARQLGPKLGNRLRPRSWPWSKIRLPRRPACGPNRRSWRLR